MSITVSDLSIFPVKSLAGISLESAELGFTGLRYDRKWMVVTDAGKFMTQRTHPQMAVVETRIDNGSLVLESFGMEPHEVPTENDSMTPLNSSIWGDRVNALDCGDETAEWLSQAIGEACRLVVFPASEIRHCDSNRSLEKDHTHFADGFPLLIISSESLDDLNGRLAQPVEMKRFRPNIVVSGCDAFAEDHWQTIRIGKLTVRIVDGCARCSIPTVDPATGMLSGPEPIHTLSSYRQRDDGVYFGVNAAPDHEGRIVIGDPVEVID